MKAFERRSTWVALLTIVLVVGCEDEGDPITPMDAPLGVSFAADVQPIFSSICAGCHGVDGNGGLDLRAGQSHGNLVGVVSPNYGAPRVAIGKPGDSVLYDKVSGGGAYGSRMPLGGSLSASQIETIRRWIAGGAADD